VKHWSVAIAACALNACVYTGSASNLRPDAFSRESGWIAVHGVRPVSQRAEHDCGPAALEMVLAYWHRPLPKHEQPAGRDEQITAAQLRDQARASGMLAFVVEGKLEDLLNEIKHQRPVIVGLAKPTARGAVAHYEVVVGIHAGTRRVATLDPTAGWRQNSIEGFLREWIPTGSVLLVILPAGTGAVVKARARPL
jgi:ABC-type bacteriocin/lantibiotic exporter with double-glycine peptidase domain